MKIPIYQIDAFADCLFAGNPAAICPLEEWLSDELMQNIAMENNLAETAFVVMNENNYEIRWFTPSVEVDLCGHATLAAAYMIFNYEDYDKDEVVFNSPRSGELKVRKLGKQYQLDFPADSYKKLVIPSELLKAMKKEPIEVFKGKTDYLLVYNSQEDIEKMDPDFNLLSKINARGIIVTAEAKNYDFVSRWFGPQSGINEDPVTGSAHTTLTPYWGKRLKKNELSAKQLSKRGGILSGGILNCTLKEGRVKIAGHAKTFMIGMIEIN